MNPDNPNEMECPNCGELVYMEVLVCPKCGLHFYEQEVNELDESDNESERTNLFVSVGFILIGFVVSGGLAFGLNQVAAMIWPTHQGAGFQGVLWVAGPLGALAGGYLVALLSRQRVLLHGLLVGLATLVSAYFLEAYWQDLSTQPLGIATLAGWIVIVACGVLGSWLWESLNRRSVVKALFLPLAHSSEQSLYLELLSRVRHDINTAERLIELERHRNPKLARAALIQNALEQLERDRR